MLTPVQGLSRRRMGAHDFRAMHLAASHQDTNLISLGADAAATVYMLPIVCAPALEPLMRFLANTFPDAAMRTVRCCSVGCLRPILMAQGLRFLANTFPDAAMRTVPCCLDECFRTVD